LSAVSRGGTRQIAVFVIEAKRGNLRWISGVFKDDADATRFLERIPDELAEHQRLYEVPLKSYPVFIIEEKRFELASEAAVAERLAAIKEVADDLYVYFNIYRLTEDYEPDPPGSDYMGELEHYHVDNRFLADYRVHGFRWSRSHDVFEFKLS
jgi:hypothetical protein